MMTMIKIISGEHIDVPATHAAVGLRLRLPGARADSCVQFYLGLEGFCGFHGDGGYDAPWLNRVRAHELCVCVRACVCASVLCCVCVFFARSLGAVVAWWFRFRFLVSDRVVVD